EQWVGHMFLKSLSGEFVDASAALPRPGGRFLEMGKTDVRDPAAMASSFSAIQYRAFDLAEAGPDRIREMLDIISDGFASGSLQALPIRSFPISQAQDAFRFMAQAKHVGKIVLSSGRPLRTDGTYLITGGLGELGLHVARWLARRG